MATDEYLLEAATFENLKLVRIYRWEEPTISLGYFQDSEDDNLSTTFHNLPAVRRLSGGGAILHDRELTYSFVLPADDPLTTEPTLLYARVHDAIVELLRHEGIDSAMRGTDDAQSEEPFLCFVRGDRHDIMCCGHKIVGSAQRRRKGAVLQHGSILLEHSTHAPQIPGINDLRESQGNDEGSSRDPESLATRLGDVIAATLGIVVPLTQWPDQAASRIAELQRERYCSLDWKQNNNS